jgi:hypothetical protein
MGDWGYVRVDAGSSAFDYVDFRYSSDGLALQGKNQSVKHSTFTQNTIGLDAVSVDDPTKITVTNNTFYNNDHPVQITSGVAVDNTNVFHNPAKDSEKNKFQAIEVRDSFDYTVSYNNVEVPYAFPNTSARVYVNDNVKLTLASGVVLKFADDSGLWVEGAGTLEGAAGATFTSYSDDSVLGDSNGDGASSGTSGAWEGVYESDPDTWLVGANVRFAANPT